LALCCYLVDIEADVALISKMRLLFLLWRHFRMEEVLQTFFVQPEMKPDFREFEIFLLDGGYLEDIQNLDKKDSVLRVIVLLSRVCDGI
jgi:hypothetical protein